MRGGSWMKVVPKQVMVRVNRLALRRVGHIGEAVFRRLGQHTNHIQPNIESIKLNVDALRSQCALLGSKRRVQFAPIIRRRQIERCHRRRVPERIRHCAKRRDIRHEKFSRAR